MRFLHARFASDPARTRMGDRPTLSSAERTRTAADPRPAPPVVQPVEAIGGRYRVVRPYIPGLPAAVACLVPIQVPADSQDADA